jgi:hypothetical protein
MVLSAKSIPDAGAQNEDQRLRAVELHFAAPSAQVERPKQENLRQRNMPVVETGSMPRCRIVSRCTGSVQPPDRSSKQSSSCGMKRTVISKPSLFLIAAGKFDRIVSKLVSGLYSLLIRCHGQPFCAHMAHGRIPS